MTSLPTFGGVIAAGVLLDTGRCQVGRALACESGDIETGGEGGVRASDVAAEFSDFDAVGVEMARVDVVATDLVDAGDWSPRGLVSLSRDML